MQSDEKEEPEGLGWNLGNDIKINTNFIWFSSSP